MTEVLFYHLTESKLDEALPALIEKSLERDWRVAVEFTDPERRDELDVHLWTYRDDSFLPHGTDDGEEPERQPVLLTVLADNINKANIRFFVNGATPKALDGYDRAILMFDGYNNEEVEAARSEWKRLKAEGHALTYWQQTPERRWVKKA
ncbi:DNA polymerase III subunit chi [Rhizobiaceae bacterium BDR2-2]|uniref:DNA polymerase III subunit chi n=1 Tax=Ectorhizobium quercum TaxID=2965071 RepID=A0AAE3SW54_9HYPH|nr:DNA polymerase III subunit chi [Ectorhizobium quercum]MCX8999020.1 DNA polymerase III subunit chi [Ectorhizobium quercum]